ncbi:MAG: homoserine dehydrogenase [Elusimicrobia bacterium]|nr:homoserine dehydrogenase [Elusimicrobiota bacterium]
MKSLSVAVAGLGTVGREAVRLLRARRAELRERLGAELVLTAVADRDAAREARALGLPPSVARFRDPFEMIRRADPALCVELLGGLEAPRRLAALVLGRGGVLVTANKRLLAHDWPRLAGAARRSGARLAFEGSVAGGIPILRALELSLSGDRLLGLDAILNGTTNYVLTRCEEGLSAAAALAEAQALGFAERDPSLDLSGGDAAQKLTVLTGLATGGWLAPGSFPVDGIRAVETRDAAFARERLGRAVRLVASLRLSGPPSAPRAEAGVFPTLVPLDHPLASVRRQRNALLIRTASAGDLLFSGEGAGAAPTASAVLADLFVTARDLLGGLPAPRPAPRRLEIVPPDEAVSAFYLRVEAADRPGVLAAVAGALGRERVSIASIHQEPARGRAASVTITTHPSPRALFERARRRILALPAVSRRHCAMRMLA